MNKLYLDIETTGLDRENHKVTVVGAYDGDEVYQLIRDKDLCQENIRNLLEEANEVVTFNGKRFDIPFLEHNYEVSCEFKHKDLMYLGWKLDWYGGLKKIEKKLGIDRGSGVTDGKEAVKLWKKYKERNHNESLKKLLKYNREDVINLTKIEKKMEERI